MVDYRLCNSQKSFQPAKFIFDGYPQTLIVSRPKLVRDNLAASAKA